MTSIPEAGSLSRSNALLVLSHSWKAAPSPSNIDDHRRVSKSSTQLFVKIQAQNNHQHQLLRYLWDVLWMKDVKQALSDQVLIFSAQVDEISFSDFVSIDVKRELVKMKMRVLTWCEKLRVWLTDSDT